MPDRANAAIDRAVERMLAVYNREQQHLREEHGPTQERLREKYQQAVDLSMQSEDPDAGILWFVEQCMAEYGSTEQEALELWDKQVGFALNRNRRQ